MAQMKWNDFINKYQQGNCVLLQFPWLTNLARQAFFRQHGKTLPRPNEVIKCVLRHATGDWAINRAGKSRLIILENATDVALFNPLRQATGSNPACTSVKGRNVDLNQYVAWASPCGLI